MSKRVDGRDVLANFLWRFAERCGAQVVSFIVQIILARLLMPDIYGMIALVTVFIAILQVFIDGGLANSLIQKKDADDIDFSTVFYFNLCMCILLYLLMWIIAPVIGSFYNNKELISVIRVLSLVLIISGVKNVQQAYVSRTMQFKRFFFATLCGTLGAAIVGIVFAYFGFGVWALVFQQLFNTLVDTIILWMTVKWRPKRYFSWKRFKELFSFGWKLLVSGLLDTIYNKLSQLIIGKVYSSADLAFYNRGQQFPEFITSNINTAINSVLLPTMSSVQDDKVQVKNMTRRAIKISTFIMAPFMMGLFAVGEPLVRLLLTTKWIECVPYLRVSCIIFMFYPIHTANLNALNAIGRSDIFLKLEVIKKVVGLVILICTVKYGVMAISYGVLFCSFLFQIVNSWPNKKLLDYGYMEQIRDIIPTILLAVLMCICVFPIQFLGYSDLNTLVIQVFVGVILYILGSILLKNESFYYIYNIIRSLKKGKMNG